MSLDDVLGQLRDGLQQWETGAAALEGAVARAEELSQRFGQLGAEGQAARLAEVRQLLESARAQLNLQTPREAEHLIWQATGQQGTATVGDPVSEPRGESAPGSFRQELNSTDDGDRSMSKTRRAGRGMARRIANVHSHTKDTAKTSYKIGRDYSPPQGPTYETVGVPRQPAETVSATGPKGDVGDSAAGLVLLTVVAVEGLSRAMKRRR